MSVDDKGCRVRLLDTRKDMPIVADLIELCFGSQLDPDSLNYLAFIRKAAANQRLVHWSYAAGEMISYPLNGYVCEKDGQVVGNVSLIPFYWKREWYYLIANVAVHPDFRQQGIAKSLTAKTLEHLARLPIRAVWLHVREDNLPARHLYETFRFSNRCMRDTWVSTNAANNLFRPLPGIQIELAKRENWQSEIKWLTSLYPPEVTWNMGFDAGQFKPGIFSGLQQLLTEEKSHHWGVQMNGQFAGAAVLRETNAYADQVFLAWPFSGSENVLTNLLTYIKANHSPWRTLLVNFPSHLAETAFAQAGFQLTSRLIWMEIRIN